MPLLLDPDRRTIILTRQFRTPAYLNGHPDGMLVEAPARLLDQDDTETIMLIQWALLEGRTRLSSLPG